MGAVITINQEPHWQAPRIPLWWWVVGPVAIFLLLCVICIASRGNMFMFEDEDDGSVVRTTPQPDRGHLGHDDGGRGGPAAVPLGRSDQPLQLRKRA